MHNFGHIRPFIFGLPLLVAVVCALSSISWGACRNRLLLSYISCTEYTCFCSHGSSCGGVGIGTCYGSLSCNSSGCFAQCSNNPSTGLWCLQDNQVKLGEPYCVNSNQAGLNILECDNDCELDSASAGGIILECQYDPVDGRYYRWTCHDGTNCTTGGCQKTYYASDEVCLQAKCLEDGKQWVNGQCVDACNDHVPMPDKCEELWQTGYGVDGDGQPGGGGYWAIVTFECYYDSCAMSLNCTEKSNFPAGSLNCSDFQDTTGTPGRCVGTVGPQCIIQCGNSTHNCDCDGLCERAFEYPACGCPQSSSSGGGSSSSGESSSSSPGSSSSGEPGSSSVEPGSSAVEPGSSGSGSGSDWEYNYNPQFNQLVSLNTSQVGYLSDIDKQIAQLNAMGLKVDNSAVVAAVTEGTAAQTAGNDTLHSIHGTLDHIDSALNTEVETPDVNDWLSSASNLVDNLYSKVNDTASTIIGIDSLKADTSNFKSKYSSLFISGAYTRDGCYQFEIKESGFLGRVGRQFKLGAKVDFGDIGGFDLCSILRGVVRAFGAILCLLITIKAYRSAFSSSDG